MNPPASTSTSSSHKLSYMSEPESTITEQILQLIQLASNQTVVNELNELDEDINWQNVIFVKRHPILRNTQLVIGVYGLLESMFYFYLSYDVIRMGFIMWSHQQLYILSNVFEI